MTVSHTVFLTRCIVHRYVLQNGVCWGGGGGGGGGAGGGGGGGGREDKEITRYQFINFTY